VPPYNSPGLDRVEVVARGRMARLGFLARSSQPAVIHFHGGQGRIKKRVIPHGSVSYERGIVLGPIAGLRPLSGGVFSPHGSTITYRRISSGSTG